MDLSFSWKVKYKGFSGRTSKRFVDLKILRKDFSVPTLASPGGVMALGSKVTAWIPGERSVQKTP